MHVGIANPRRRGKCSRHSPRMFNPQCCVSGKRPITAPSKSPPVHGDFPSQRPSDVEDILPNLIYATSPRVFLSMFFDVCWSWPKLHITTLLIQPRKQRWQYLIKRLPMMCNFVEHATWYILAKYKRISFSKVIVWNPMGFLMLRRYISHISFFPQTAFVYYITGLIKPDVMIGDFLVNNHL